MPVVGVATCRRKIKDLDYDCTQHKYLIALYRSANVLPLQIPLLGDELDTEVLFDAIDGILLTGSHSNIHPANYTITSQQPGFMLDIERDKTFIPLIKPAINRGIPLLALCRGFQELNVAFGGSIHTDLSTMDSSIEHGEDTSLPIEKRYEAKHTVNLVSGNRLNRLLQVDTIKVNSLHDQGIDKLGDNLVVEGYAADGLIEAISVEHSKSFAIGVQWHPEWHSTENPVSTAIFSEFGKACHARAQGAV
jgi:putative glutamine amidotransferase